MELADALLINTAIAKNPAAMARAMSLATVAGPSLPCRTDSSQTTPVPVHLKRALPARD